MIVSPHHKLTVVVDTCLYLRGNEPIPRRHHGHGHGHGGRPDYQCFINHHLLLALAELPSIKAIIFPSIVADWEILGGLTDAKGQYHQIRYGDKHGVQNRKSAEWFLGQCNRGKICVGEDGKYSVEEVGGSSKVFSRQKKHPKLWVLDTPEHTQILEKLLRKRNSSFSIDDINDALKPDAGEHCCLDIAQQLPWDGEVLFLSDDINYVKTLNNRVSFTPFAQPIAHGSSFSFLGTIAGLHQVNKENIHPIYQLFNRLSHSYFSDYFSRLSGKPSNMRNLVSDIAIHIPCFAPEKLYDSCGVAPYVDEKGEKKYTHGIHEYIGVGLRKMGWRDSGINQLPLSTADIQRDKKTDTQIEVAFNKAADKALPVRHNAPPSYQSKTSPILRKNLNQSL
ncbi:MAG: hypothetical protein ACOYK8_08480 [Alphaproteobacteria bacterium]